LVVTGETKRPRDRVFAARPAARAVHRCVLLLPL
jgi:hypothetical protein